MKRVVLLGQTPPPVYGQSVMLAQLVNARWDWCEKSHVRMDFSSEIDEVGKFAFQKLWRLVAIVGKVWKTRMRGPIDLLYFPPGGPHRIPFYRDAILMLLVRWCAKRVLFQFHAGDFDGLFRLLTPPERLLAHLAYGQPDGAIVLLPGLAHEVEGIRPRRIYVVPNGVADVAARFADIPKAEPPTILWMGQLHEGKGLLVALEAISLLRKRGRVFRWRFVGGWASTGLRQRTLRLVTDSMLGDHVHFVGVRTGDEKWTEYASACVFCLPTFLGEAMPLTIVEAQMMSLPVVTTRWRGIPDMVQEGKDTILVPARDAAALADALDRLLADTVLREDMGRSGREHYVGDFSLERHLARMEAVFHTVMEERSEAHP